MVEKESNFHLSGRHHAWADPILVVEEALKLIEPDGSIIDIDDETNEPYVIKPDPPVNTQRLPNDRWAPELLALSRKIAGSSQKIIVENDLPTPPQDTQIQLILLAHTLQRYRHDRDFINKATSLIKINKEGHWHPPRLPGRIRNWYFSPEIRILRGYDPHVHGSAKNK